ncbi:hypothetical protein RWV98_03560 [Agathobaculum sp. NTUH-O15-33]|uniref:hypothetical protein n=1 Tax=Agathobaculum sp. NTUH-O15-33 TaxID=3079302 RepID=UPI002958B28B|nr:hypothetical protein [Agathobaculum sp. NTUH-O15-33]WNX85363.1 hypothetical protein RWV98_03560 [Agathobaculum sp. NTUH-O15-33]
MKKALVAGTVMVSLLSTLFSASAANNQKNDLLDGLTLDQSIGTVSYATVNNEEAIAARYGIDVDEINTIATSPVAGIAVEEDNKISFQLHKDPEREDFYSAKGVLVVNGLSQAFTVTGQMYEAELANGDMGFSGGLSGYLDDDDSTAENLITLSLNYNASTAERLVTVSIGENIMLDFGSTFETISDLFYSVNEQVNSKDEVIDEKVLDSEISTRTVEDTELRQQASGVWNGYQTTFSSIWGQSSVRKNANFKYHTKTQANRGNFIAASRKGLPSSGSASTVVNTIEHAFTNVWNINNTMNSYLTVDGLMPTEFSKAFAINVSVPTPYALVNKVQAYFTNISIPLKGISHDIESNRYKWTVNSWGTDMTGIECSSTSSPYKEENGFTSVATFSNEMVAGNTATFHARGEVEMFYGSVRGNGDVASTWKTVATSTMEQRLTSLA